MGTKVLRRIIDRLLGRRWIVARWFWRDELGVLSNKQWAAWPANSVWGDEPPSDFEGMAAARICGWFWLRQRSMAHRFTEADAAALALLVDGSVEKT